MEDILNRVLNPILGRFLANKEKPNLKLNFLKGRGVMRNLVFNTDEINKLLQDAPIRVAVLAIDQLSIKASLTRISTQPVTVFIDHINLEVYEPPVTPSRQPAASDPVEAAPRLPQPTRHPYGLSDRIADGIRVQVNEIRVRLRTLGRRKCPNVGEHSPPDGLWTYRGVQWCSTNEAGVEGDLEECWRFNKGRRADYYIFKRLSVEAMSFYVVPRTASEGPTAAEDGDGPQGPVPSPSPIAVLQPTPMECRVTCRRGLRDVTVVHGVEVDVQVDRAVLRLGRADGALRHFLAWAVALAHCLARKHAMPNMPNMTMPPSQVGEDGCQPPWRDPGEAGRMGPSAASGWTGPSSAFSSSSGLTSLDDVALEQRSRAEGQGEEQGEEDEEEEEEEGDEESVGSDDSGFSHGVSAASSSFLPDLSSLGDLIGDEDDHTATTASHGSSSSCPPPSYAPSFVSSSNSSAVGPSPRMRAACSLAFARLEVRLVDEGEGGFVLAFDGLRSEVIRAEDAGPSEFIGQGRLGRVEVRALGTQEEVLWHEPALLRPHVAGVTEGREDEAVCVSQPPQQQGANAFPALVRRGIRLDRDFPGLADEEGQDEEVQGLLAGGGDVLRVRNHVMCHPPPPPPEVASRVEARLARLHVHLDLAAWARLQRLLGRGWDRRWWDGEWGPALEGYVLQPRLPMGIRHVVLRGAGIHLHLPPAQAQAAYEGTQAQGACLGAGVDVRLSSYSLRVGDHLPGCLADAPGFLDPRLPSTPPPSTSMHTQPVPVHPSTEDGPCPTPAPLRLQVSVSGLCVGVGSRVLLPPFATTMLLSVDAHTHTHGPTHDLPPRPCAYVPLSPSSRLSISLSLEPVVFSLHLPSWLNLAESLTTHLATLKGRHVPTHAVPAAPLTPSPHPQGGGWVKGAALLLVLKAGGLRLVLPEHHDRLDKWAEDHAGPGSLEGRSSRREEKGDRGGSPGKRPSPNTEDEASGTALMCVEVTAVEAVAHVSHAGATTFDCLVGRCTLGLGDTEDTEGMVNVAEIAPPPRGSKAGVEEEGQQGREAGVLVRWRREAPVGPMPSSEGPTFLPPQDQSASNEQAGPDVAIRLSLHVLCPLTLRAPLPRLTAAATALHTLLCRPHASSLPLPSPPPSLSSSAFPRGSLAHALLCLLPHRPALHPLMPSPSPLLRGQGRSHSRPRAAVGVVDVALTSLHLHLPLPLPGGAPPCAASGGLLLKACVSDAAVQGTMELRPGGGRRAEQSWTIDGTLHASLATPQKTKQHRQSPPSEEVVALSSWRVCMGLRVLRSGSGGGEGEHGHWRVLWQPPTQPLTLHPSPMVQQALRHVHADLTALLTTCGDLFAGGGASGAVATLHHLDTCIAAMGGGVSTTPPPPSCAPQAEGLELQGSARVTDKGEEEEGEGEEELDVIERLARALRSELHAQAYHASAQAAALCTRLHATQQALDHATHSYDVQLEAMGERLRHKECQRMALLALHHADHSGYLRVGALANGPTTQPPGRGGRQKGWSSKALLSLPRAYCVLRGNVLLCYDRAHSLVVTQALPLCARALADFLPRDHASPRYCRRAYALLYRGTPLLPDSGHSNSSSNSSSSRKTFLLVAEGEDDLRQWKTALAAYFIPPSLAPQDGPASDPSSPRATARRATAPAISRTHSLDHLPPTAPSTSATRSLRRSLLGRGGANETAPSVDGPVEAVAGRATTRDGPLLRAGKTIRHSFSFSPGRMLLRVATTPGRAVDSALAPTTDKDRAGEGHGLVEGTQAEEALQQAAEAMRRLQLSVTGVVAMGPPASSGGGMMAHRPEGERGTGLGGAWGASRDSPVPCYIIATSPPVATPLPDGAPCAVGDALVSVSTASTSGEEKEVGVQACVSRTWAELLSFHGRYHEHWAMATQAIEEEEEARGGKTTPRRRPNMLARTPKSASSPMSLSLGVALQRGEARGYANALLMGMQAPLSTLSTHEAGRRLQGDTVERYLSLLLSACPAHLECLRLLAEFIGHDLAPSTGPDYPFSPRQPARAHDAVDATSSAQQQPGREREDVPAPDLRTRNWNSGSASVSLPPPPRPRRFSALVPPSPSLASDATKQRRTVSLGPDVGCVGATGPSVCAPPSEQASGERRMSEGEWAQAEMAGLRQAAEQLQTAHAGAALALPLQSALFDDYRRVGRRRREEDTRARQLAEEKWREEVRRATWLEAELNKAQAARDDALTGLDQVASYSAKKLVDAEGRYEELRRSTGPHVHKAMSMRRLSTVFTRAGHRQQRHGQQQQQQQEQQAPQTRWGGGHAHGAHGLTRQHSITGAETTAAPPAHLHRQLPLPAHPDQHASPRRGSNPLLDEAETRVEASLVDRLSRQLEAKSLEAQRAEEGRKMAVEEARGLRAMLAGQGRVGEEEGRRLREEVQRERARAEALERELAQVRAEWRAMVGEAVEALRGEQLGGKERTKAREPGGQRVLLQALLKALNARGRLDN